MTITQANYLDIGNLLINELFGDVTLFIIVGIVVIGIISVKNNIPATVTAFFTLLWVAFIVSYYYNAFIWMLVVIFVGILIYAFWPKIWRRN